MISERPVDGVLILDLPSQVDSEQLMQSVTQAIQSGQARFALNLANITFIESSGLGALVAAYKRCVAAQANVVFFNVQPYVQNLMTLTRLDRLLKLAADEVTALAAV